MKLPHPFRLAGALALLVVNVTPALASPTLDDLFNTIKATGTRVVVDDPRSCKDPRNLGQYEFEKNKVDQYTICVANHKGNNAELYDTVLHEAVHVAQACKGTTLFSYESIIQAAKPGEIQLVASGYPQHQFNAELEARVIAREQDEVFITGLLKQYCFK